MGSAVPAAAVMNRNRLAEDRSRPVADRNRLAADLSRNLADVMIPGLSQGSSRDPITGTALPVAARSKETECKN